MSNLLNDNDMKKFAGVYAIPDGCFTEPPPPEVERMTGWSEHHFYTVQNTMYMEMPCPLQTSCNSTADCNHFKLWY